MIASKTYLLVAALCFANTYGTLSGGRHVGNRKESSSSTAGPRGRDRVLQETEKLVTDDDFFNGAFGDEALLADLLRGGMSMGKNGMGMGGKGKDSGGMGGGMDGGGGSDGDDDDDDGMPQPSPKPVMPPVPIPPTPCPVQPVQPTPQPVQPVQPTPQPVQPVQPTPFPTPNPVFVTPNPITAPPPSPPPTVAQEACPVAPPTGCSVCGNGMCITLPDVIFSFPGQPSVACSDLENAGLTGLIPLSSCGALPGLIEDTCGCADSRPAIGAPPALTPAPASAAVPPTPAPTLVATPAPIAATCPDVPPDGCSICGDAQCVTNPDAVFMFGGQPDVPCGTLQIAGYTGLISLDQCPFLPTLVNTLCGCQDLTPRAFEGAPRLFEHVGSGHHPGE